MDVNSKYGPPPQSSSLLPPPQQQQLRSSARLREHAILFQVLDNPSLREEILKCAIIGADGVDQRTAGNLRLVHSNWNDSVLRLLWKAHKPLCTLAIGEFGKNYGRAMRTFAPGSPHINGPTAPLRLEIAGDIRKPENLDRLSNCLARFGSLLVETEINANEFGRSLQRLLPNWSLPRLQKLEVTVVRGRGVPDLSPSADPVAIESEMVIAHLINCILSGATALTELDIVSRYPPTPEPRPIMPILESVTFPTTLAEMMIAGVMARQDLELLTATPRYSLTSLTLCVESIFIGNGLFFRILDNCRRTLKKLCVVQAELYEGPPRDANRIGFPVMEELEQLSIYSIETELEEETSRSLRDCLPKLRTLRLYIHTGDMVRKWTEHSKLDSVTSLEVLLADDNENEHDLDKFLVSVNAEAMQMANCAFPNLRKLELSVSKEDTSGLEYVFKEMRQLTELKIRVCSVTSENSTDAWDSILTGVPVRIIGLSKRDPNYWAKIEHQTESPRIYKLVKFKLDDSRKFADISSPDQFSVRKPYFSDFTFRHALLQMPKLRCVEANFEASDEIRERWLSDGRTFLKLNVPGNQHSINDQNQLAPELYPLPFVSLI